MQSIKTFSNSIEATLARDYLRSQGVDCEINGAKEYAAHVAGGSEGHYHLLVNSEQIKLAQDLLAATTSEESASAGSISEKTSQSGLFAKAVALSLVSFFLLPVIGNILSVYNGWLFFKQSKKSGRDFAKVGFIILLQGLFIFAAYKYFFSNRGS